jgi:hypothetical protein
MSSKNTNKVVFIISNVENLDEFHWELSELSRKFPSVVFRFKKHGGVNCRYEDLPILEGEEVTDTK